MLAWNPWTLQVTLTRHRILTAGLARPCLIPTQHVRMDVAEFLDPSRPNREVDASCSKESLVYFRHVMYADPFNRRSTLACADSLDPYMRLWEARSIRYTAPTLAHPAAWH